MAALNDGKEARLRAGYKSYLPKYGGLWRSMAPQQQQPHSFNILSAIENRKSVSVRACDCPFDCQGGCAEPIVVDSPEPVVVDSPGSSSSSSGIVGYDLSHIRVEDQANHVDSTPASSSSSSVQQVPPPEDRYRDALDHDDSVSQESRSESSTVKADEDDESVASSSSSDTSMQGWDLSHIRLDDDDDTDEEDDSKKPAATKEGEEEQGVDVVVDLLDVSSEDDSFVVVNDEHPRNANDGIPEVASQPPTSDYVEYIDSSSEEEWADAETGEDESKYAPPEQKKESSKVVNLYDSDNDDNDNWLVADDESQDDSSLDVRSNDGFAQRKPQSLSTRKIPRKDKTETKAAFRKRREEYARQCFSEFDAAAFDGALKNVEIVWSNKLRTTAGLTRLKTKRNQQGSMNERTATIELSTKIIDEEHRLRSTLLHEMCHAAAWLVDGTHKPPHGACFKKWAKIAMRQITDVMVTTVHDYEIAYKFAWACTAPHCGWVVKRHSRSVDVDRHRCGKCRSTLIEIEVPTTQQQGQLVERTPRKKAPLSGYNLFVKQNSQSVRDRLTRERQLLGTGSANVTQQEVMKECAKLWRVEKTNRSNA